jgi:hypothetical protein
MGVNGLDVRIDELVLEGFAPADRFRIAKAIRIELSRLMGEQGRENLFVARNVDGGSFHVGVGMSAEAIGGQVARAVHGGLTGKASPK